MANNLIVGILKKKPQETSNAKNEWLAYIDTGSKPPLLPFYFIHFLIFVS